MKTQIYRLIKWKEEFKTEKIEVKSIKKTLTEEKLEMKTLGT